MRILHPAEFIGEIGIHFFRSFFQQFYRLKQRRTVIDRFLLSFFFFILFLGKQVYPDRLLVYTVKDTPVIPERNGGYLGLGGIIGAGFQRSVIILIDNAGISAVPVIHRGYASLSFPAHGLCQKQSILFPAKRFAVAVVLFFIQVYKAEAFTSVHFN